MELSSRRLGTTVREKYRVDKLLGVGGMASVYAATHRNGRQVALKVLHPELSVREDLRARFRREAQAANAVKHPGVVEVIDDDVDVDGSAFLVMELLEGHVLEKLWQWNERRLSATVVLAVAREVCEVLIAAHRAGIVHRDLKPENLFLTNDGRIKVLDFGLAHLRDLTRGGDTQNGMVFGTPSFMPPEQAHGRISLIDARTDIWALGATMFTLLSGVLVHDGETPQHTMMLSATEAARTLNEVLPDAHPALAVLVDRALTWDQDQRWPTAQAMRDAILGTSRTLFGEDRPDVPCAPDLIPANIKPEEEDEHTRTDRSLEALVDDNAETEPTQVKLRPSGPEQVAARAEEDRTEVMDSPHKSAGVIKVAVDAEAEVEHTSVMVNAPVNPRTSMPTQRIVRDTRGNVLPWALTAIALVVAIIAVIVAVLARR